MEKRRSNTWLLIVPVVLITICMAAAALFYFWQRARAYNARPLVLIHNPLNRDEVATGEGVFVHATARSKRGVTRLELWADDVLLARNEAGEQPATPLVLTADWVPQAAGTHQIVARAVSADGISGQSAVGVIVVESGETDGTTHIVAEDESLASIAEDYGTAPEELAAANPELGAEGPAPGDSIHIPDDEPPAPRGEEPLEDEEPPLAEDDGPSGSLGLFGQYFGLIPGLVSEAEAEQIGLQVEVLELTTAAGMEGLHCYIGLAGNDPSWYPDADGDQSTDESFEPLAGVGGDSGWDVEPFLMGDAVPIIFWQDNEPLPFEITCVGVTGGGTQALDLGRLELTIPPEEWNGTPRSAGAAGADGSFAFQYRVNGVGDRPRNVPMYLDVDMTPPINARLDDRRISLRWDYNPREDEDPIDGFRIYLNGNLQWVEPPDSLEAGLPYEWFNPPCGTRYTFLVTAFRYGFPDGPESMPALAFVETPAEDCTREIQINFVTLETFDLGGDGRYEDRHGDIGPPYGYFYANERQITFDARPSGGGGGSLDMPNGLTHNTTYDLMSMSADPTWGYSGMSSTIVDVPQGGSFEFGFHIMDQDTGRCNDSDDRGCDDLICEGFSTIYDDTSYGELDQFHEGTLTSDDGRCRVSYTFGPAFGSPVGTGVEGWEPLPWISVEELEIDEASGQMLIHVRNTGTATWPWRDLTLQLQTRDVEVLQSNTWTEYVLEPGQRDVLEFPGLRLAAPFDACVLVDPQDDVLEEYERSGALVHQPICPPLVDLAITRASFAPEGGGRLRVIVRNVGDHPLENRTLAFETLLADGSPLYIGGSFPNVSLGPREERFFEFGGVSESVRERMAAGYTVVVNPDATIAESNMENNTYTVAGGQRLRIYLYGIWSPYSVRNYVEYNLDAYLVSGTTRRQVADWHVGQDIDWGSCFDPTYCILLFHDGDYDTYWFDVYGDENLEVVVTATHPGSLTNDQSGFDVFGPGRNWGAGPPFNYACSYPHSGAGSHTWYLGGYGEEWTVTFHICQEDMEP